MIVPDLVFFCHVILFQVPGWCEVLVACLVRHSIIIIITIIIIIIIIMTLLLLVTMIIMYDDGDDDGGGDDDDDPRQRLSSCDTQGQPSQQVRLPLSSTAWRGSPQQLLGDAKTPSGTN